MTFPEARALKQDNVLVIGPFPEGHPLEEPRGTIASGFRRCNIALVVAWPGWRPPYPAIARLLHRNRIPFSLVLCGVSPGRALAAFFPLEDPSPCWRCLELRWLGWQDDFAQSSAWLESLQFPVAAGAPLDEEDRVILAWGAMDMIGADAGSVRILAYDGTYDEHNFLPHPQCAWCSPWAGVKWHRDEHPKASVADLADERFGLIAVPTGIKLPRSMEEVPPDGPDEILLDGETPRQRVWVANGSPYFGAWKGELSCLEDRMPSSLVLDGLARYATRLRAGRPLFRGTRRGVAVPAPNPRDWIFPLLGERSGYTRFSEDLELDWARGHDLHSGDTLGIPADLVFDGPPADGLAIADVATAVAHPKLTVAVRWALSHVAENDAMMAWWLSGLSPPRVPVSALPLDFVDAFEQAEDDGMELAVLDLTTDIGLPVLAVVGRADGRWFYGCGGGMMPTRALRAAWARLGQCFARGLPDPGPCVDFLFAGPRRDFPSTVPGGDTDPIDTWRYLLEVRGMQALWIDITPPDLELARLVVARAWIAGAVARPPADVPLDLDPDYVNESPGGARLLELPMKMGLTDVPLQPEDLNAAPHPFI